MIHLLEVREPLVYYGAAASVSSNVLLGFFSRSGSTIPAVPESKADYRRIPPVVPEPTESALRISVRAA